MTGPAGPGPTAQDPVARHALAKALRAHPAVLDAEILDDRETTVCFVPEPETAALLHRSAEPADDGEQDRPQWHEPADDLRVAGVNRTETDFLYREIFLDNAYLRHGLTVPERATVVDVGANIGMFALRAAAVSPGARIIAVEPAAEPAAALARNAGLYGLDVTVLQCALGGTEGETDFTYYPGNSVMSGRFARSDEDIDVLRRYLGTGTGTEGHGQRLARLAVGRMAAETRRCAVSTLTQVVAEQRLDRIDLLKIDVEKAEADVLAGIDDALWPRIDRIAMEVHDIGGRLRNIVSQLRARGFEVHHDQDPRLAQTPCHNVYARAPQARAGHPPAASPFGPGRRLGPTLRVLERELRALLSRNAPGHTAPGRFVAVQDLAAVRRRTGTENTGAPQAAHGPGYAVLAEAWAEVFGAGTARPDANFFALGGNSLTAVRLLGLLEDRLGEDILEPDLIFTAETLAELAAALDAALRAAGRTDVPAAGTPGAPAGTVPSQPPGAP
ncbi:FkbM family methyltransferase [Streptomyces sp. NPDC059788]|uniref:FkbM family methyltransferase n=1 Tax=Streptomyces sp. NPDC059788 TaxID=3346948 RepID=UPI003657E149